MQIKIQNGTVDLSGQPILKKVDIEINTESKIGIVGRNGCGKTTLLRLIAGELEISKDDPENQGLHIIAGKPVIGTLSQMTFKDDSVAMIDEIKSAYSEILHLKKQLSVLHQQMDNNPTEENISAYTTLLEHFTLLGGFYFEKEYEAAIKRFGFSEDEKFKPLSDFSGGQRTKIAFLKLLLSKPDLLLLDEPTNHLDVDAVSWLEEYLSSYKKAVVIVSHDRMFLDKTINEIYEIERGKTYKYPGNYSKFIEQKAIVKQQQMRAFEEQQKEIARLNELIEKFRYKANKAAMAQSKIKYLERMELIEKPESYDNRTFRAFFEPDVQSVKDVLTVRDLGIGYDKELSKLNFSIQKGQHVGIIGGNGLGKSTLLKTIVGTLSPLSGSFVLGASVKIGYFDQQMAQYTSKNSVLSDFLDAFPNLTDFEARSALGAFLFSGDDVFKTVDMLSGGERVRLALCKIFKRRPNFLILDEPTNHMDILGKEALENMLSEYSGTLLFVSHDRYFIKKVANKILSFENGENKWFDFGFEAYEEYLVNKKDETQKSSPPKAKKTYTTPGKEKARKDREIKKAQNLISELENKLDNLQAEINKEENISDYMKLTELQIEIETTENLLLEAMEKLELLTK